MSGALFPITEAQLEKQAANVDAKMESVRVSSQSRVNLNAMLKDLTIDGDWMETKGALREGFSLYYELYDQIERRIISEKTLADVSEADRRNFLGAYAMFGATSFIESQLGKVLKGDAMEAPWKKENLTIDFSQPQNDVLTNFLAPFTAVTGIRKTKTAVRDGQTLAQSSIGIIQVLKAKAMDMKPSLNKKLVDLVSTAQFRVMDEFTLTGFESKLESATVTSSELVEVEPHEVAGNVLSKKEMFRDMDRMLLYDPILKKNPAADLGALSWSVLYVGLPGTGKTTLFLAGYTRAKRRCEQVSEFWKEKNFGKLYFKRISVDPKVKDKMYGGTSAKMDAADQETADPARINIGEIDDIDLLMEGDRDAGNGGADKDILNGLMRMLGGVDLSKRRRGNTQWWAATNAPTKMDPALLQRFGAKYEVTGPEEWYDFADILMNKLGGWIKLGDKVIQVRPGDGYTPFEMRKGQTGYEVVSREEDSFINEAMDQFKGGVNTFRDLGTLCAMYKKRNPRFTGRAIDSVTAAINKKINDYDIPESWFVNPNEFAFKAYEERKGILTEMCQKVYAVDMAKEIIRYARIEEAFANNKFKEDVAKELHALKVRQEAIRQLQGEKGK